MTHPVTELPEPVRRVAAFLSEQKVEARIEQFSGGTPTAEDAARAAGCDLDQIVKSLVFLCDDKPVLVMVSGDRRADRSKIAAETRCRRAKVAGPADVLRITGFEAGGVAPFPLPGIDLVLMDSALLAHPFVWIGAGTSSHMAVLAPADLARLTQARALDLVERSDNVPR
jgi:prolyl-tRNA editing enzyme YbaK/EbsC (Cys-tRNA(Pro) deacylase)